MKYLIIDACARKESRTKKLYQEYIKNIKGDISIINLYDLDIKPLDEYLLNKRDKLIFNNNFDDDLFKYAKEFKNADYIIVAAPYWDLSFPSILKIYFENISISGLTFTYDNGIPKGLCKCNELLYLSTCGGYVNNNLGYEYIKELVKMFGINNTKYFQIDGLDIDINKSEEIFNEKIKLLKNI